MKVQSISANSVYQNNLRARKATPIRQNQEIKTPKPYAIISFGAGKRADSILFVGAECPPLCKEGGVGTVMNDYGTFSLNDDNGKPMINERIRMIPYYNGANQYDESGKNIIKTDIHKTADGKMWYTNANISDSGKTFDELFKDKKGDFFELEEVKSTTMSWGTEEATPIKLLKVKGQRIVKDGVETLKPLKDMYMIYTDATSKMPKPYADGSYSYSSVEIPLDSPMHWQGDPYAKFGKATAKLLPESGIESATLVLSDAQTAYIPEHISQEMNNGQQFYKGTKTLFIAHNLGDGYISKTSYKNMFVNLGATKEEIQALLNSKDYLEACKKGQVDEFFKNLIDADLHTSNGTSPIKLIIKGLKDNYISKMITVSEDYAESLAKNKRVSGELYEDLNKLFDEKKFIGILNVLNDESMTYNQPITMPGFAQPQTRKILNQNGEETTKTFEPFKAFDFGIKGIDEKTHKEASKIILEQYKDNPDGIIKHIKETKQYNKARLLERLTGEFPTDSLLLTGLENKKVTQLGSIDPKYINNPNTKLFSSWGRGDFQKALDTVYDAFDKFVKKTGNQDAVLVFGGELRKGDAETDKIRGIMKNLPEHLKGRVVFLDGFAPNKPLASASDATIFPSRFAPCELTDLESMKYFATPIVTGTQGLKQKNFDPRNEKEKAKMTGYKTATEFYSKIEDLEAKSPKLKEYLATKKEEIKKIRSSHPGFTEAKLEENWLEKALLDDAEVKQAIREYTDDIISDELADAMKARIEQTDDTSLKMWQNHMNLDTTWTGNNMLHPDGKASANKYIDSADKTVDNSKSYKKDISQNVEIWKKQAKDAIGDINKTKIKNKWLWIASAAIIGIGATYAYITKLNKVTNNDTDKVVFKNNVALSNNSSKAKQRLNATV